MTRSDLTMGQVVERLRSDAANKQDVVTDTRLLTLEPAGADDGLALAFHNDVPGLGNAVLPVTGWASRQIAARAGIPAAYWNRMTAEAPDLACQNAHTWWARKPESRLVRAVDGERGRVRAFLSDRFRVLDNLDFAEVALAEIQAADGEVKSANVDEERLYIKVLLPREDSIGQLADGSKDRVRQGVLLRNSEVGDGRVEVSPFVERLICTNGLVSHMSYGKVHLGGQLDEGVLSEEAIAADAESVWLQVRDYVRFALNPDNFDRIVQQYRESKGTSLKDVDARVVVANIGRDAGLNGTETASVLDRYLRQNDDTAFGLVNAVTNAAQAADTYRRQVEMEELGGRLLSTDRDALVKMVSARLGDRQLARAFSAN